MPWRNSWALLLLAGCAGHERPIAYQAYQATGLATWYGDELAGRPTASGERFKPRGLTAAHRTLPFGTLVEVTALDTSRTIVARINDRGPRRRDRLIDLSFGAARLLGTDRGPPAAVRVRALEGGRPGLSRAGRTVTSPRRAAMPRSVNAMTTDQP